MMNRKVKNEKLQQAVGESQEKPFKKKLQQVFICRNSIPGWIQFCSAGSAHR